MDQISRALRGLGNQDVARANASAASAQMQRRREEQEDVDAYLLARKWRFSSSVDAARDLNSRAKSHS